jgi:uncharacterized protein (DUF169 family)
MTVSRKLGAITYGPLATTTLDPDVIFLRVKASTSSI